MQIFDLIGLILPLVVHIKLLQEILETGCDWHEELPDDLGGKCIKWCEEAEELCKEYCLQDYKIE